MDLITNILNKIGNWFTDMLNELQALLMMLLPDSPFSFELPQQIKDLLPYINWIIPFYMISNTLLIWCSAIVVYYAYQALLRWIKTIQ